MSNEFNSVFKYPYSSCEVLMESKSGKALLVYILGWGDHWVPKSVVGFVDVPDGFEEKWGLEKKSEIKMQEN